MYRIRIERDGHEPITNPVHRSREVAIHRAKIAFAMTRKPVSITILDEGDNVVTALIRHP